MTSGFKRRLAAMVLGLAVIGQGADAQSVVRLDGKVVGDGINWGGASKGTLVFAAKAINVNGKVAVCGAYGKEGRVPSNVNRRAMGDYSFYIGDTRILSDVSYFNLVGKPDDLSRGSQTACRLTDIAWQSGFSNADWRFVKRSRDRYRH